MQPRASHGSVLRAPSRLGSRARAEVRTQRCHSIEGGLVDRQPRRLRGERVVEANQRTAKRDVAKDDPARGARRGSVVLGPVVQNRWIDVEHLVCPSLRDRRHPGVHRLGLEDEQLALVGAPLRGVEGEARGTALDHGDRPRRVRMGPVGVIDEARVQRLDPREIAWAEVVGVLGYDEATSRNAS